MKRYSVDLIAEEATDGEYVRTSDVRRLARQLEKIASEIPAMDWPEIQDQLNMLAKSILGEH